MDKSERLEYSAQNRNATGQWGKWAGVTCSVEGCGEPAKCRGMCMPCYSKKRWADGHRSGSDEPEVRRNTRLKHRYGITSADYAKMLSAQKGVCAICGNPPTEDQPKHWGKHLAVDHCHDTGRVRGLLCNRCNVGLGHISTESLARSAIKYLRLHAGAGSKR